MALLPNLQQFVRFLEKQCSESECRLAGVAVPRRRDHQTTPTYRNQDVLRPCKSCKLPSFHARLLLLPVELWVEPHLLQPDVKNMILCSMFSTDGDTTVSSIVSQWGSFASLGFAINYDSELSSSR